MICYTHRKKGRTRWFHGGEVVTLIRRTVRNAECTSEMHVLRKAQTREWCVMKRELLFRMRVMFAIVARI